MAFEIVWTSGSISQARRASHSFHSHESRSTQHFISSDVRLSEFLVHKAFAQDNSLSSIARRSCEGYKPTSPTWTPTSSPNPTPNPANMSDTRKAAHHGEDKWDGDDYLNQEGM